MQSDVSLLTKLNTQTHAHPPIRRQVYILSATMILGLAGSTGMPVVRLYGLPVTPSYKLDHWKSQDLPQITSGFSIAILHTITFCHSCFSP